MYGCLGGKKGMGDLEWQGVIYLVAFEKKKKLVSVSQPLAFSNHSTFFNLKAAFLKKGAAFFCGHVGRGFPNKKEAGVFLSSPAWRSTRKSNFKSNWNFSDFQIETELTFFGVKINHNSICREHCFEVPRPSFPHLFGGQGVSKLPHEFASKLLWSCWNQASKSTELTQEPKFCSCVFCAAKKEANRQF